ncbi:hypothetical protein NUK31_19625, partial [Aeromonas caviae]|uniref:hypothetical protein n=1 Tax=Aeromonas caviae TaxID=648 RepID=UPI00214E2542
MTRVYEQAKRSLQEEDFSSFKYLSAINRLLSNPVSHDKGRDLIVRALDARERFSGHTTILKNMVRKSGLFPVSIHRNSIDTGKMRRSSLDPTFLLA